MLYSNDLKFPVLTYHSIDPSGSVISKSHKEFKSEMELLREIGFRAVSLDTFLNELRENGKPAEKTVVLTFDDGFRNFYEDALPILNNCGFGATVFLVAAFCGKHNDWEGNPPELPRSQLMSWNEIREAANAGIEFGSHTMTHRSLARLKPGEVKAELIDSKKMIEDKLGKKVSTFAYPFGEYNDFVKRSASEQYDAACSTLLGKVSRKSDIYALERLDAYYLSNRKILGMIESSIFDGYIGCRNVLRKFRAAIA